MAINEPEDIAVAEVQVSKKEIENHELVAPTNNLIIYGKSPEDKNYKALGDVSTDPTQVSNLVFASLIKPDMVDKAKALVDILAAKKPSWDFKVVETGKNKKWYEVKGDPNYVAPVEVVVTEEKAEEVTNDELPAETTTAQAEQIVSADEQHTTEVVVEKSEEKLADAEESVDELSREVILNQIKGLNLIVKYKTGAAKKAIADQIKALKMTLELI